MKIRFPLISSMALVLVQLCAFSPTAKALITINYDTSGDWDTATNWVGDVLPWENAAGDTVVDTSIISGATMTVNTTETFTGTQFGGSEGNPFQFRRANVSGSAAMTIEDGGVFDFSGAGDSRITANSTGSTITMTGGVLKSTRSNLGGLNLGGSHGEIGFSGSSSISIFEAGASNSGITVTNSSGASGAIHLVGSNVDMNLEALTINGTSDAKIKFTMDNGGASAFNLSDQFDLTLGTATIELQLYLADSSIDPGASITLFNLTNGSNGVFDSVTTSVGTYSGAEGTTISIASAAEPGIFLDYKLTYLLAGNNIGLQVVPEPGTFGLLGLAGMLGLAARRRRSPGRMI